MGAITGGLRGLPIALAAGLPWAFGGVPAWAWAPAAALLGAAIAVQGLGEAGGLGETTGRLPAHPRDPYAQAALLVFLALLPLPLLQSLPGVLPGHPLWAAADTALPGATVTDRAALVPGAAGPALALLGMVAGAAWLTARVAVPPRALATAVAASAALAAGYGLGVQALGGDLVLWVEKPAYRAYATGPFVNRNAFAAFCGLGVIAFAASWLDARREAPPAHGPTRGLAHPRFGTAWLRALALTLLVAGLAVSQSRAGVAATGLALAALLAVHPAVRRGEALAGAAVLAGIAVLLIAPRLAALDEAFARRAAIHAGALEAIAQRPWFGYGLGGFEAAFRMTRPPEVARVVQTAHSGYLHAFVVLGVPGGTILIAAFALLVAAGLRGTRRGRPGAAAGFGAGVLAAAHALVDFAPQTPGVALAVAVLLGAGVRSRRRDNRARAPLAGLRSPRADAINTQVTMEKLHDHVGSR